MSALEFEEDDPRFVTLKLSFGVAEILAKRIADEHRITVADLKRLDHHPDLCEARRELYLELRAAGFSYPKIGSFVGRHHTTIRDVVLGPGARDEHGRRRRLADIPPR